MGSNVFHDLRESGVALLPTTQAFVSAYIKCALWSTNDESDESGGEPFDKNYGPEDLADETLVQIVHECQKFLDAHHEDIDDDRLEQAGHDFWLTRNGHGSGFEDGYWPKGGERLARGSREALSMILVLGDDGKIHAV